MRLKNRIAIVTGAARGIGLAIAERFVAEGADVVISDIEDMAGEAAAVLIGATYIHCDVSKPADVAALVAQVVARYGAVDLLVNNAGISMVQDFLEITEADMIACLASISRVPSSCCRPAPAKW